MKKLKIMMLTKINETDMSTLIASPNRGRVLICAPAAEIEMAFGTKPENALFPVRTLPDLGKRAGNHYQSHTNVNLPSLYHEQTEETVITNSCRASTTVTRTNSNGCSDTVIHTQVRALRGTRASPWAGRHPSTMMNLPENFKNQVE
ncbi:hypothetical protein J6590_089203 [Homalodisca vitripennis]|nr:hypothetical protein J6590_089203 [Homalodisca vitripennis]